MTPPRPRKALIIGAGIAGPVVALFLKRAGIDAAVFEAWPYSTGIGGGLQIAPNGMHVLAELTGLTTGAITGVIDRLEKAGFVRRERDEIDRRKVFIATVPEAGARIGRLYVPMQEAMQKLWSTYSDGELQLLLRFGREGYKAALEATEALNGLVEAQTNKPAAAKKRGRPRR